MTLPQADAKLGNGVRPPPPVLGRHTPPALPVLAALPRAPKARGKSTAS